MYALARQAAVRMIVDTIEQLGGAVQYFDWDDHAEPKGLPNLDLFGLQGFSCTQNGLFHDITFGVGIMTRQDTNLGKMVSYADLFYRRLAAMERFPLFNEDGTQMGFDIVVFDGTSVSPQTRVDQRPALSITAAARLGVAGFTIPEQ